MSQATIGVIGGSGLYELLSDAKTVKAVTPFGEHSNGLTLGSVGDRAVAFLPRHGLAHQHPPHSINYRANIWALRSLGVTQVLAPCAVGSLQPELAPGTFVLPDQLVDRTHGRTATFVTSGAFHVGFADPYCDILSASLRQAGDAAGIQIVEGGTMVVIEGPRFSTRAESLSFRREGWTVVNMTGMPEAVLCREMAICYAPLALVTDFDAGSDAGSAVRQEVVFQLFAERLSLMRRILTNAVPRLPLVRSCHCAEALQGLATDHVPASSRIDGVPDRTD
jgi:5'-methylthioadenosine phosphorylase